MTLLWIDGFDHYSYDQMGDKGYIYSNGTGDIASGFARFSGQGVRNIAPGTYFFEKVLGANKSTVYMGIAFQKYEAGAVAYSATVPSFRFKDEDGVTQVRINATPTNKFAVYQGDGTLLGTTAVNTYEDQKWHFFEFKITISATVGVVEIRKDETTILNLTAQDTKNGSDYIRSVYINGLSNGITTYFDDLYIDDAQFHGNCRVQVFLPDADGNSSQFTRSTGSNDYECVDDNPSNDGTDYISSSTVTNKSIFGITTGVLGTVKGIQLNNHCRVSEPGLRKITPVIRSNSTDYDGTETGAVTAGYRFESEIWETDPDDSQVWTQTKLEAAEFGLEVST